jgi:hypothetical protein
MKEASRQSSLIHKHKKCKAFSPKPDLVCIPQRYRVAASYALSPKNFIYNTIYIKNKKPKN